MANVVDFVKEDEDGSYFYKCTVRGEIHVAKFQEMKLWLEKKEAWGMMKMLKNLHCFIFKDKPKRTVELKIEVSV